MLDENEFGKEVELGSEARAKAGDAAIIVWPHKLVLGTQRGMGVWTGKVHPNATTKLKDNDSGCPNGCLFDISVDPTEHVDISAKMPEVKAHLLAKLSDANATTYQTNDTPGFENCRSPKEVEQENHGFVGMVCTRS